ncbi:MAG TPA: SGNH/GDSL hydrolase family protein [Polyangiaceae bacterium]|nr:SGNH/GDSL hydrolase family protein [Polyangiaceae bacterium]
MLLLLALSVSLSCARSAPHVNGNSAGKSSAEGATVSNGNPARPRLIGRFDESNPTAPVFAWSGAAIAVRFAGTAIGVTLGDAGHNVFEVVLDGAHTQLSTEPGTKKYSLGSGLRDGPHDLLLYRRSEALLGETTFNGFDLAPNAYLPTEAPATRRLEVIGDSISAGYGNEGTFPCQFAASNENHYLSYAALSARGLRAELHTAAWSGIGMRRSHGDLRAMPELYSRTLPERATSQWDFSKYVPDAVIINLGTNDFAQGDPGVAFQTTYTQFVRQLRGYYPGARFFLAVGPMLEDADYALASSYLRGVVAARAAAGDKNLTVLEFGIQDRAADGLGCDYHPSLKTHQKMADKMTAALRADLAW